MLEKLFFARHLERGEKVLFVVHHHWVLLTQPGLLTGFFGFLIPWTLYLAGLNMPVFFWTAVVWSISAYLLFMKQLFHWHANAVLITSEGVLHVQWKGFFNNVATRVGYDDVEGVVYVIKGFWGTVLRYGQFNLRLFSGNTFTVENASRPDYAEIKVMELKEKYMHGKNLQDAEGLKKLLSELAAQQFRKDS